MSVGGLLPSSFRHRWCSNLRVPPNPRIHPTAIRCAHRGGRCGADSTLEATLYDLPAVAALARPRLAGSSLAARQRIVEGDFFTDPLPEDHDAILLANILHNFLPEPRRHKGAIPE